MRGEITLSEVSTTGNDEAQRGQQQEHHMQIGEQLLPLLPAVDSVLTSLQNCFGRVHVEKSTGLSKMKTIFLLVCVQMQTTLCADADHTLRPTAERHYRALSNSF